MDLEQSVVGVGRGLAAQDDLKMVHELAAVLNAEVGCSRPIAEGENWMERERLYRCLRRC